MTLHHHLHTLPKTQCRQYLSYHWPHFDQTLKIGYWDHLEQILSVAVTFVQAIFVLVTFVHIRNTSTVYRPDFDQNLKVGSWDHFEQMPTATATFIQVTFVLVTFVYKRNISAVTDPFLTKLFEQDF